MKRKWKNKYGSEKKSEGWTEEGRDIEENWKSNNFNFYYSSIKCINFKK